MKRFDSRVIFGGALVLLGGLLLLERVGLLRGAASLFWGVLFLLGAAYFFRIFLIDPRAQWWAVIPGMVLFGIGGEAFLPAAFAAWGGALFLASIGVAFWVVYMTDRARWWGIIPGGVLLTLAVITIVEKNARSMDTDSLFFLGLGLTFLLVALLPNPLGKTQWAYIPAAVLVGVGALIGGASTTGLAAYMWPLVLILSGGALIFFYFFKRE